MNFYKSNLETLDGKNILDDESVKGLPQDNLLWEENVRTLTFEVDKDCEDVEKLSVLESMLAGYSWDQAHARHYQAYRKPSEEELSAWIKEKKASLIEYMNRPENASLVIRGYDMAFYEVHTWIENRGWYKLPYHSRRGQRSVVGGASPLERYGSAEVQVLDRLTPEQYVDLEQINSYEKYSRIIKSLLEIDTLVEEDFRLSPNEKVIVALRKKLYGKAREVLALARKSESTLGSLLEARDESKSDEFINALMQEFEGLQSDIQAFDVEIQIFKNIFQTLKQEGLITTQSIENIEDISVAKMSSQKFIENPDDVLRISSLLSEAYVDEPEEFRKAILDSFHQSIQNPDTHFYTLKHQETLVAGLRFDDLKDIEGNKIGKYFGSFISDSAYSNGKLGEALFEKAFESELDVGVSIKAHCDPTSDIAKKYIESGFVAKETETVAGKFSFEIWRTKDIVEHLKSKQMSIETLLAGDYQENNIEVREVKDDEAFEELDEGLGYLLTRYFKHAGKTYAVFEIPSPTLWNQFQV